MPRQKSHSREMLVENAMHRFWAYGFAATSMDDLVSATKVSRGGIYADFGGKRDLFLACMAHYAEQVVSPALAILEAEGAGRDAITAYFDFQIERIERAGLPGNGCLVANSMTEIGPHDAEVQTLVSAHHDRLSAGFLNALTNEAGSISSRDIGAFAACLATSAQGLWSYSRSVTSAEEIVEIARLLVQMCNDNIRQSAENSIGLSTENARPSRRPQSRPADKDAAR